MINIRPLTGQQIEALHPQFVTIYRAAFTAPPYNKQEAEIIEFTQSLPEYPAREAFRCLGAFSGKSDQLVGFAYGYACKSEQGWYRIVQPALGARDHWLQNSFQFAEIAVDPQYQGQGLGGKLHDQLLSGVGFERAVLSTLQADTAAHNLYRRRGWQVILQDHFFPGVDRRYQIMGLMLNQRKANQ